MPDELFPNTRRIVYEHAPLLQVVLQLRFLPILRIESDIPSAFQEHVRADFPGYQKLNMALQLGGFANLANVPNQIVPNTTHQFLTQAQRTNIALASDALTIATTNYRDWHWFRALFKKAADALNEIYAPTTFTRIGLRYTNGITPSLLNQENWEWRDFLNSEMLGELQNPTFAKYADGVVARVLKLKIPEGPGHLVLRHGLNVASDVQSPPEPTYTVDFDFSTTDPVGVGNEWPIIDQFHELSGRAFRWSITDRLHGLLGPTQHGSS